MTFLSALALAVGLLVAAPYIAHRLRRRRAEEEPFPPARLVAPSQPKVRQRARIEDRALLGARSMSVILLAILGATPFVRCSRLAVERSGGASIAMALVVDDSMSMRAGTGSRSRFDRAREGARELLASAREGDAIALILAGAPPRVALAATTDLRAARDALDALVQSDRATDLDGAIALARDLVASLPQRDRRVVLLSDLCDGLPGAPPLAGSDGVPLWTALPELAAPAADCAVLRADRNGFRVRAHVACGPGATAAGRSIAIEDEGGKALGHAAVGPGNDEDVTVVLPSEHPTGALRARLLGTDAIAADDVAPVIAEASRGALAVVADPSDEAVATGGAPVAEQALAALEVDLDLHPLPQFPDRVEDLAGTIGVLIDDPPGWTPEQRRALGAFLERGGAVMLALGPRAAAAPLGATLEPVLGHAIAWSRTSSKGADPASAAGPLAESAASLVNLAATRRATLTPEDTSRLQPLVTWTDGALLAARRPLGRGEAWIVTLPLSIDASDLALRPAFLTMLNEWVRAARTRAAPERSEVGTTWLFPGARSVEVEGPSGTIVPERAEGVLRLTPAWIGTYRIVVDGKTETRVAAPVLRELDLRPRAMESGAAVAGASEDRASVDASGAVAMGLLAVFALEMILRARSRPPRAAPG